MSYLQLDGSPRYYELRGSATSERPIVIFFNGWCLSGRYWEETLHRLENQYQLLVFDSRGFGRSRLSGPNATSYHATIKSGTKEAFDLLARLDLQGRAYHVVGHSLGGVTAAHFATQAEAIGQLSSLTIVNSGSFDPSEPQGSRLNTFVKIFVKTMRFFDLPLVRGGVIARSIARPIAQRYARIITEDFTLADQRLALELALASLEPPTLARYQQELAGLKARLLLIVGDKDGTIPPKGMYNIRQFKPEAHLVPFPDCGHLPMLERPARFAEELGQHFAQAEALSYSKSI